MWDSYRLNYLQAASDTRTVGAKVAAMVAALVERGLIRQELTWCIGHSLGAHACGRAGKTIHLGRITG